MRSGRLKTRGALLLCGLWLEACAQLAVMPTDAAGHLRVSSKIVEGLPVKIVCFGDSITGVYYHTGGRRSWCDLLGIALTRTFPHARVEMINAGVSGNDTDAALKRMEKDVLRHTPDLVVVMFGMNDVRSLTPVVFRNNLQTIVQRARGGGAEVMLMTPNAIGPEDPVRPSARLDEYVRIVRDVGRKLELPVVDTHSVYAEIMAADPAAWQRLMSDTIHPNLRGHRIFAEEVARAITDRRVSLSDLPVFHPRLPCVLVRLNARQPVRVLAMPPYDALIAPALRNRFPDAVVEVTTWQPDAHSLAAIEAQAKETGWWKFRGETALPRRDLVVLAVPSTAQAPTAGEFFHSYYWIMNWSLSNGNRPAQPDWDCLVVLPSVAEGRMGPDKRLLEEGALDAIGGQDLPWLRRQPGERRSAQVLFSAWVDTLLAQLILRFEWRLPV